MREETRIRKIIVITGLILLIAGIVLAVSESTVESRTEENVIETWDMWPHTLNPPSEPWNHTFWGRLMQQGWWFEFDVSASHPVRITVSVVQHLPDPWLVPIFDQVGTRFTQSVTTGGTGTYQVDIINEGPYTVDLEGSVTAKREETRNQRLYPYAALGTVIALIGVAVLSAGIYTKSTSSKRKK